MVVRDDQIETQLAGALRRLHAANAAIHRHHHPNALRMQTLDRPGVQPVAVLQALGNEVRHVTLQELEGAAQHDGGADSIGIVVAVHGDRFASLHGTEEPLDGAVEVRETRRVVQIVEAGVQEPAGRVRVREAALDEQTGCERVHRQLPTESFGRPDVAFQVAPDRSPQRRFAARGGREPAPRGLRVRETPNVTARLR